MKEQSQADLVAAFFAEHAPQGCSVTLYSDGCGSIVSVRSGFTVGGLFTPFRDALVELQHVAERQREQEAALNLTLGLDPTGTRILEPA